MFAADVVARIRSVLGPGAHALHTPVLGGLEWERVREAIDSGWVSSAGPGVGAFEAGLQRYTGIPHAVALVNGTAALHLALHACGVRPGDEVLVPSLTFVAPANAVRYCGATPHWVESDRETLGVDAVRLREHLERVGEQRPAGLVHGATGRPIRALVAVHNFGHPAAIGDLALLCDEVGIALLEDAAESLGSRYRGRHTGGFGRVAVSSFNGNKTITTGGGGAILTADGALADRVRHLSTTARRREGWSWGHDAVGWNYRMPALNAALGSAQLERLPRLIDAKRALAGAYREAFRDFAGARVFEEPRDAESNHWLNLLVLDRDRVAERDAILDAAHAEGLEARPAWTPLHRLELGGDCPAMDLSVTDELATRLIALPSTPRLPDSG